MAKYFGSPWGFLRGKLNDAVGGYWKGIEWTRVRLYPTQRGTYEKWRLMKDGLLPIELFSYEQFNIRRLILQLLGWIGRTNQSNLIYPVWMRLCRKKKLKLTGINLFVKRNAITLWASIPEQDEEYVEPTNKPDMNQMLVSDGDLEPSPAITSASYNPTTGIVAVDFDTTCSKNGKPTDFTFIMTYAEPIVLPPTWLPNGHLWGTAKLPPPPAIPPARSVGHIEIPIEKGLDPLMVHAYVFFRDVANLIGYSPSISATCS